MKPSSRDGKSNLITSSPSGSASVCAHKICAHATFPNVELTVALGELLHVLAELEKRTVDLLAHLLLALLLCRAS